MRNQYLKCLAEKYNDQIYGVFSVLFYLEGSIVIYLNPLRVVAIKLIFASGRLDYKIVCTLNPIDKFSLGLLVLEENRRTLPLKSVVKFAKMFYFFFFASF